VTLPQLDTLTLATTLPDTLLEVAGQSPDLAPMVRFGFACVLVLAGCIVAWTLREREDMR